MSNKTQLQTNNTNLDALITRVNAAKDVAASLPEAGSGSGGSVETCNVTVVSNENATKGQDLDYFNIDYSKSRLSMWKLSGSEVITVPRYSLVLCLSFSPKRNNNLIYIGASTDDTLCVYQVIGDATIELQ
jgi:hypothetical protein